MTIDVAYNAWAPSYDGQPNRTRDLDAGVARQLSRAACARLVEAGCGTGKNTVHYAALAAQVLALDFSGGMLAIARERISAGHVQFQQADLQQPWPCAPGSADRVAFHLVLEHIADLGQVLGHAATARRPGGQVVICELHPARQYRGSQAHYLDAAGRPVAVTAHVHHISDYLAAAAQAGLTLVALDEHWHADDARNGLPRLLSLVLQRCA